MNSSMQLLRAFSFVLVASFVSAQCFEKYQCMFFHTLNDVEYKWDLHQLCRESGPGYIANDTANSVTHFNICGNSSAVCAPSHAVYDSHGVAVRFDSSIPTNDCDIKKTPCKDYDYNLPACCTGECAILLSSATAFCYCAEFRSFNDCSQGTEFFQFYIMDANNPRKGVFLVHAGLPSISLESVRCPIDPRTGLRLDRQLTVEIYCDSSVLQTNFIVDSMTQPSPCRYMISGRSSAACGIEDGGNEGEKLYNDNIAHSIGFVLLGALIAFVVLPLYTVQVTVKDTVSVPPQLPVFPIRVTVFTAILAALVHPRVILARHQRLAS